MRKLLTIVVLALVIGGAVGTLMTRDPGYVLVSYAGTSLETSLWFALAVLIVGYVVLRGTIAIGSALLHGSAGIRTWRQGRRSRNAQERTQRGLLLAGEGDWAAARKTLSAVAAQADTPLVNYLVAARAANELGDTAARDGLLDRAAVDPAARLTVTIARAEMQLASREFDAAAATLQQARIDNAANRRVLELLVACYEAQQNWAGLLALGDELKRQRLWSADALAAAQRRWWAGYFHHRLQSLDAEGDEQLASLWSNASKELRHDPDIILAQAEAQLASNDIDAAEATLRDALNAAWSPVLVERYSRVHGRDAASQFAHAQRWLKKHPDDAALQLALGRLALYNADHDAAREYFERSVALQPSAPGCSELGRLCAQRGDHARAAQLFADAAAMHGDVVALSSN